MTQNFYLNVIYSIRKFLIEIDSSIPWYIDEVATMNERTFAEVITSVHRREDDTKPYVDDFVNVNVYSKDDVESVVGKIIENLQSHYIPVYDLLGDGSRIGTIMVERYETIFIGAQDEYRIMNVSIYYKVIE